MMTVKQARKLLGKKESKGKSDKDIQNLLNQMYLLCDITTEIIIAKYGSKGQVGVIDPAGKKGQQ